MTGFTSTPRVIHHPTSEAVEAVVNALDDVEGRQRPEVFARAAIAAFVEAEGLEQMKADRDSAILDGHEDRMKAVEAVKAREAAEARVAELERYIEGIPYENEWPELKARLHQATEALGVAAEDLEKAANQFEALKQAQESGHPFPIINNPLRFAGKAERARSALAALAGEDDGNTHETTHETKDV